LDEKAECRGAALAAQNQRCIGRLLKSAFLTLTVRDFSWDSCRELKRRPSARPIGAIVFADRNIGFGSRDFAYANPL